MGVKNLAFSLARFRENSYRKKKERKKELTFRRLRREQEKNPR